MRCTICGAINDEKETSCAYCGGELGYVKKPNRFSNMDSSNQLDDIKKKIVKINVMGCSGTGFLLDGGYVVTNYHTIEGKIDILITFHPDVDGKVYEGKLVKYDEINDIAIVKIDRKSLGLIIADSNYVKMGDKVFTIGNPAEFSFSFLDGSVSNPNVLMDGKEYIQTNLLINHGNSGGPLISRNGQVIGMMTFTISKRDYDAALVDNNGQKLDISLYQKVNGISFAIPSNTILSLLKGDDESA